MPPMQRVARREFLRQATVGAGALALSGTNLALAGEPAGGGPSAPMQLSTRIEGMLIGSLIGDALGGPVEFQPREAAQALPGGPKGWRRGEKLDAAALDAAKARFALRGYSPLRPVPEPYGHWATDAPPGTLTDDSRHKMVLMQALRNHPAGGPFTAREFARGYLSWGERPGARDGHRAICKEWLAETEYAARWVLGERDARRARPPERLWVGLPTCMGQMALPPLAACFAGRPDDAYRAAYNLAFFDNGFGKDLNAGLVAALAVALASPTELDRRHASWEAIRDAMLHVDPYDYKSVPWTERAAARWIGVADLCVKKAEGEPARLIAALDREFTYTTMWEAQVPVVAMIAFAKLCDYRPLESMQVCMEWGHDTDSYAQLLGAFFGALHGPDIFPEQVRAQVQERMLEEYGEDLDEWVTLLLQPLKIVPV